MKTTLTQHRLGIPGIGRLLAIGVAAGHLLGGLPAEAGGPPSEPMCLWYARAATNWNEALPLGNGRLGAMVFGGIAHERLQLNEGTLYSGYPGYRDLNLTVTNEYQQVAGLIAQRRYAEAEAIIQRGWRGKSPAYIQPLGDLFLDFEVDGPVTEYRRELDLARSVCRVSYRAGNTHFTREVFASYPDQVIVVRLTADRPGSLNFSVRLASPHPTAKPRVLPDGHQIVMPGQVPGFAMSSWLNFAAIERNHETWKFPEFWDADGRRTNTERLQYNGRGMFFHARLQVLATGGSQRSEGESLRVSAAKDATLILAAASSFNGFDQDPVREGAAAEGRTATVLQAAADRGYAGLWKAHQRDYQALFGRVTLELGPTTAAAQWPTDQRLKRGGEQDDPGLAALYFQFGRYLMIAGSRPGGQAMNLMGLWNESRTPAWNGVPTLDMNLEMNYWPAEVGNLPECAEPLFQLIRELAVNGRNVARDLYGRNGWVAHHQTSIWRCAQPIIDAAYAALWDKAGAWLCQHLYEHYLFTGDEAFLRDTAYPLMKGACEFYLDGGLVEARDGTLTTPISTSPENRFLYLTEDGKTNEAAFSAGCTMDLAILRELFGNTAAAAERLGVDPAFRRQLRERQARLAPFRIGARGHLQEWGEDFMDKEPDHRHHAHLYALHPGNQITRRGTPELAAAAARSLELRGPANYGWSAAWKISLFARLGDSRNAYAAFRRLLETSTLPNLLDEYPKVKVMQIDANFGACAGIAELLLQSHAGELELLPALPAAWPEGKITGLRARGGFTVELTWKNGKVTSYRITSRTPKEAKVRVNGELKTMMAIKEP